MEREDYFSKYLHQSVSEICPKKINANFDIPAFILKKGTIGS